MDSVVEDLDIPPVISVAFKPQGLPPGAVDLDDFSQFLDGLRLTLEGITQLEVLEGNLDESIIQPRLTIVSTRASSVIIDITINIFSNNSVTVPAVLTAGAIGGIALREQIRAAIKDAATGAMKDGIEKAAKAAVSKTSEVTKRLVTSLKTATNSKTENKNERLSSDLLLRMLPGLRKMAKVGAKQIYGRDGVTLSIDGNAEPEAKFNVDAQRHIEQLASEALASSETIELIGTIEDPSRRKHRFVLDVPTRPKRDRYIPCFYKSQHEDLIRELYRNRDVVKVSGEKRYKMYSNSPNPRTIVLVSSIEVTRSHDLWGKANETVP